MPTTCKFTDGLMLSCTSYWNGLSPTVPNCVQEALFPNCSFQAPCNGWTICNNFRGKAITRARNVIEMYHHRNRIQDTCGRHMRVASAQQLT